MGLESRTPIKTIRAGELCKKMKEFEELIAKRKERFCGKNANDMVQYKAEGFLDQMLDALDSQPEPGPLEVPGSCPPIT